MKKYKIGYVQGSFDMFHIGHLLLLQRAKACCEYLRVGVVSDAYHKLNKGMRPCITYEDRAAIVGAIGEVDEVVGVEYREDGLLGVWEQHPFDCYFSGDDHAGAVFLEPLRSKNIAYEFFPYTKRISTTKLRHMLRRRILYEWAEDYPFEQLPTRVAVYGAGNFGRGLYGKIRNCTRTEIVCWVDKAAARLQQEGLPVELPIRLLHQDFDQVVIAVKRQSLAEAIRQELVTLGIPREKTFWIDLYGEEKVERQKEEK